jgi:hypothetical protein
MDFVGDELTAQLMLDMPPPPPKAVKPAVKPPAQPSPPQQQQPPSPQQQQQPAAAQPLQQVPLQYAEAAEVAEVATLPAAASEATAQHASAHHGALGLLEPTAQPLPPQQPQQPQQPPQQPLQPQPLQQPQQPQQPPPPPPLQRPQQLPQPPPRYLRETFKVTTIPSEARRAPTLGAAAGTARVHRAPPTRARASSSAPTIRIMESAYSKPARGPMQGLGVRVGTPNPFTGRLERALKVGATCALKDDASAASLYGARGKPVRPPPKPVSAGTAYTRQIQLYQAHSALGRVISQRERYLDWATNLLEHVLPELLKPIELRRRLAAGTATAEEQAEIERIEGAEAAAGGETAARTLAARREELQQVLATLGVLTLHVAEQIEAWRHVLGDPELVPTWFEVPYPLKARRDVHALLAGGRRCLHLLGLTSGSAALMPLVDPSASLGGAARYAAIGEATDYHIEEKECVKELRAAPAAAPETAPEASSEASSAAAAAAAAAATAAVPARDQLTLLQLPNGNEVQTAELLDALPRALALALRGAPGVKRVEGVCTALASIVEARRPLLPHQGDARQASAADLAKALRVCSHALPVSCRLPMAVLILTPAELLPMLAVLGRAADETEARRRASTREETLAAARDREIEAAGGVGAYAMQRLREGRAGETVKLDDAQGHADPHADQTVAPNAMLGRELRVELESLTTALRACQELQRERALHAATRPRRWQAASAAAGAQADDAFAVWLSEIGLTKHVRRTDRGVEIPSEHPPPPPLPTTDRDEPTLSASAAQCATFASAVVQLPAPTLLRALYASEASLQLMATEEDEAAYRAEQETTGTESADVADVADSGRSVHCFSSALAVLGSSARHGAADGLAPGMALGHRSKRIELSQAIDLTRHQADNIEGYLRRRTMVGLRAVPPPPRALERSCGRAFAGVHVLMNGAACFIQSHVRCWLALGCRLYVDPECAPSRALPDGYYEALRTSLDEIDEIRRIEAAEKAFVSAGTSAAALASAAREPAAVEPTAQVDTARVGRVEDRQLTAVEQGEVEAARRATMAALRPTAHRILLFWQAKRNPRHLVRNDDTFLSPLILARRHKAAIKLQCAFRRYQAIRWKTQAIAARRVQRVWRSGVLRARLLETARLALGAAGRLADAMAMLREELNVLEARCQPKEETMPAGLRAITLIRGRVLDGLRPRVHDLVAVEVTARRPHPLTRDDVRAILARATVGLFGDVADEAERTKQASPDARSPSSSKNSPKRRRNFSRSMALGTDSALAPER